MFANRYYFRTMPSLPAHPILSKSGKRYLGMVGTIALCLVTSACQHLPSLPFTQSPESKAEALTAELPPPVERQWPNSEQDVLNQRARGYGLVRMPEMQDYLNGLLRRIKTQAGVPEWPGKVYILAAAPLEAYATAAGNIYISQSWLSSIESEDEMVALLSHEFGHIYLHYHQLQDAVEAGDTVAKLATLALAVSNKTAQTVGWTSVDSLAVGYLAGRDLLSAAWGRSQESAADTFGMNVSIKMGYTYEAGFKALLERMADWVEENDARQEKQAQALLEQVKAQAAQHIHARNDDPNSEVAKAMFEPLAQFNVAVSSILHQGTEGLSKLWNQSTDTHPNTLARLDALAAAVDILPLTAFSTSQASTDSWRRARAQTRTAQTLKNYAASMRAIANLSDAQSLKQAQAGASGITSTHSFPLHVLLHAQNAHPQALSPRVKNQGAAALDKNIRSEPDRAWSSYIELAQLLRANGQVREAGAVMSKGFEYFRDAGAAWPQTIAFIGEFESWEAAKKLAAECRQRFSIMASACANAATTPSEKAESQRQSEVKVQNLFNRVMGR